MIMGLGTQMVAWHEDFCEQLGGSRLLRDPPRQPRHRALDAAGRCADADARSSSPAAIQRAATYTLADMAGDSVGVLDHLGIERAHVVGASMGGMIAQTIAIRYPHRTLSMVSIMSNTGSFWKGQPALTMYALLLRPAPNERSAYIQRAVDTFAKIGGSGFEPNIEDLHDIASRSYDRGHDPKGSLAPARRDHRRPRPQPAAREAPDAGDRHPRHRGQARAQVRRPRDRTRDPGREAGRDPGHGPRPAARRVADDHRRDRRDRRARYPSSTISSTIRMSSTITAPVIAPRLPLIRPEARVGAIARVTALGRLADPVVVVGHHATAGTISRPISSTISVSRCARCWRKMPLDARLLVFLQARDDALDRAQDHRLRVLVAAPGPRLQLAHALVVIRLVGPDHGRGHDRERDRLAAGLLARLGDVRAPLAHLVERRHHRVVLVGEPGGEPRRARAGVAAEDQRRVRALDRQRPRCQVLDRVVLALEAERAVP